MEKLFIIGNGFDLSHGLATTYEDFHEYLRCNYVEDFDQCEYDDIQSYLGDLDDKMQLTTSTIMDFIEYILAEVNGITWGNLEDSLSEIDYDMLLPDIDEDEIVEEYDIELEDYYEYLSKRLYDIVQQIPLYFSKWIDSIDVRSITLKQEFCDLYNKNDLFLSFNYTKTLELKYGIKDVCHIHGVQGGKLLFGHGKDEAPFYPEMAEAILHPGTEYEYGLMRKVLRKDTQNAIRDNEGFFKKIHSQITSIYSYGFSFSSVDRIYLQNIFKRIDTNQITWFFNDFDSKDKIEEYKNIVISNGFKGEFEIYHI